MNIINSYHSKHDYCKAELTELMKLDQDMMNQAVMINQIRFAWKARGNDKNILFNNNKYNKITKEYLKCFEYIYLNFLLHIIEKIETHVLTIRSYHQHLIRFADYRNFKFEIEKIRNINRDINSQIKDLEEHIVILIQDIKDINIKNNELDEIEKTANDIRDRALNINY